MLRRFRGFFSVALILRSLPTGALLLSSDQEIRALDSASISDLRGGEPVDASAIATANDSTMLPSISAMDARTRQLLEAQEVVKAAEYKVASECMRLENERTLMVVKQGLVAFQQEQHNGNRGPAFIQMADQIVKSVGHLVDLAQASGVFSGYADEITAKDLAVATKAKALHLDEEASMIDGAIGRRLLGREGLESECAGPTKCGASKFCVGFDQGKVYCYGSSVGCNWGNDCNTDADCAKYSASSAKYTMGESKTCPMYQSVSRPGQTVGSSLTGSGSTEWSSLQDCIDVAISNGYVPGHSVQYVQNWNSICYYYGAGSSSGISGPDSWLLNPESSWESDACTCNPTNTPTHAPTTTHAPTRATLSPSNSPSYGPSTIPTSFPTGIPSNAPSFYPTSTPTLSPTTNHIGSPGMNRCDYGVTPETAPDCGVSAEEISVQRSYSFGGWHLAPLGATACDTGVSATLDECRSATHWIATESNKTQSPTEAYFQETTGSLGICTGDNHKQRTASMDSWGKVPLGCSVRQAVTAPAPAQGAGPVPVPAPAPSSFGAMYFKKVGTNCNDGFQLVCSGGVVKRKSAAAPPKYLGCYTDFSNGTRDLPDKKTPGTFKHCATQCSGYKYFGRALDQCFCGDSFGSQGEATGCECDSNIITAGNPMAPPIPKMNCVYVQDQGQALPTRMPKVLADASMPPGCNLKLPLYKPLNHSYGTPCTNTSRCDVCQGRCNHDSNCKGNLRCFHRLGNINVPGCLRGGPDDVEDASFCALPGIPFVVPYTVPCGGFRIEQYQVRNFEAAIGQWANGRVYEVIQSRKGKEVRRGNITLFMTAAQGWTGKWSDARAYESVSRPGQTVGSSLTGSGSTEWSSLQDCIDVAISNGYVPGHSVQYVQNWNSICYYYGAGSASGISGPDSWLLNPVCLEDWLAGDVIRAGQSMTGPRVKGSNMAAPPGYVPKPGHFPCASDPSAGIGALCCAGSPFNDPDPSSNHFFQNGGRKTAENFCYELAEPDWLSQSLKAPIWNKERWGRNLGTTVLLCRTSHPTATPSTAPSAIPTSIPTQTLTFTPTSVPTVGPSFAPSNTPSFDPTVGPSYSPTVSPTPTEMLPEIRGKTSIRRQAQAERSSKVNTRHEQTALRMLATAKRFKKEKFDKKTAKLNQLTLLQHGLVSKLAYVDHLQAICQAKGQSKEKSSKINSALVKVKLPPDVAAKSISKMKMIHLIKASLTKLLGLSKLNDAQGIYALEQEAQRLVDVEKQLKKQ